MDAGWAAAILAWTGSECIEYLTICGDVLNLKFYFFRCLFGFRQFFVPIDYDLSVYFSVERLLNLIERTYRLLTAVSAACQDS